MSIDILPPTFAAFVTVCDECGGRVTQFALDEAGKAACVPCGHVAHVSLIANPAIPGNEAA